MRKVLENPKRGDERVVTRFLWWPKKINNVIIWWETVSYLQRYDYLYKNYGVEGYCSEEPFWQDVKWV